MSEEDHKLSHCLKFNFSNNYSQDIIVLLINGAINLVLSSSVARRVIFKVALTHIEHTFFLDVEVVARGETTIVEVSDLNEAIRVDLDALAVEFVVCV